MTPNDIDYTTLTDEEAIKILKGMDQSVLFLFNALDRDEDGQLSPAEIDTAPEILHSLDKDGDGELNETELEGYGFHWQHDIQWLDKSRPHTGDIILINNGAMRGLDGLPNMAEKSMGFRYAYTNILELALPMNEDGTYNWDGDVVTTWSYKGDPPESMFAPFMSGVDRTPSGNTVFVFGHNKRIIEVTPEGEVVADFRMPGPGNTFRIRRYGFDHPGIARLK